MKFSSQEYWSGLPFPPSRDIPDPGMEPMSLAPPILAVGFFTIAPPQVGYKDTIQGKLDFGKAPEIGKRKYKFEARPADKRLHYHPLLPRKSSESGPAPIWNLVVVMGRYGGGSLVAKLCLTLVTPWTVVCQAPLFMGFSRHEYCSGLPFLSPGDLPNPGIKLEPSGLTGRFFTYWAKREALSRYAYSLCLNYDQMFRDSLKKKKH